jgi:phosphoglycerol transferase MdoB-like AlkP superfamily enzyme
MPIAITFLKNRVGFTATVEGRFAVVVASIHIAACTIMLWSEVDIVAKTTFVLVWGFLNFFWLAVLRRPGLSAALSLVMLIVLILLSRFKHDILFMTASFVDVMIIDMDTFAFLMTVSSDLRYAVAAVFVVGVPTLVLLWRLDPFRVRLHAASIGGGSCLVGLSCLSLIFPIAPHNAFYSDDYVSNFVRSGVAAISELMTHGFMESDAVTADRLEPVIGATCQPAGKRPHIIMVHDESSFDITIVPGIRVPPDYRRHFESFDGRIRSFTVEGVGGPSWYTEYNVLAGLSVKSFGRFAYFVTQIAADRVERGLPRTLARCGYQTHTLYPWPGAFLGARSFQKSTGIEYFVDAKDMGTAGLEPDRFFYDQALQVIERERSKYPLFIFVFLAANHFPWGYRYRPELTPQWRDLGNQPKIDEYLRRQTMSARDYAAFLGRLKREFPGESFLLVRYGDHQPEFAMNIIDPALDEAEIARRIETRDPRYLTTYYAIDAVNFMPADVSSALDTLDAAYLPLIALEAAGVPLDPSFAEQKKILQRCRGVLYPCAGGSEARRFNRLLIDAGLIKGL